VVVYKLAIKIAIGESGFQFLGEGLRRRLLGLLIPEFRRNRRELRRQSGVFCLCESDGGWQDEDL